MVDKSSSLDISDAVAPAKFERNILVTAKGSGIVAVGRLFSIASRSLIAIMLARLMGAEQYGLYNLAITIATIASSIALLGLDSALVRYVAILASRRDSAGLWGALQIGVGIPMLVSSLMAAGLFILAYPIAEQVFHQPQLAPLLQLISPFVVFLTLSEVLAGATRGFKKMEYMVIAQNFVQLSFRLVVTLMLVIANLGVPAAIIVFGISDGIASVILVFFLNKEFSLRRPLRVARRNTRVILGFSFPLWLADMMTTFRDSIQTLLLGTLNTVVNVGIFSVVSNINLFGHAFYISITTAARPLIAELHDRGDRKQLAGLYQTTTRWMLTLNLPVFLILVLFAVPILSLFGKSFVDGSTALVLLAFSELVNVGTGMCGPMIDMTGHSRLKLVNAIIQVGLSLGTNILLISRWGILGAAVASLATVATINVLKVIEIWILMRMQPYNLSLIKPVTAGVAALAIGLLLGRWFTSDAALLRTVIEALIVLAVYAGVLLLLGFSPEDRMVLARVRRRTSAIFNRG